MPEVAPAKMLAATGAATQTCGNGSCKLHRLLAQLALTAALGLLQPAARTGSLPGPLLPHYPLLADLTSY